jgi:hypothetical protein
VVSRHAASQSVAELVVAEDVQVVVGQMGARFVDGGGDLCPFIG